MQHMSQTEQKWANEISKYQILFYGFFQLGLTILAISVCKDHSFRSKWLMMLLFSAFITIDYIGQMMQSIFYIIDREGVAIRMAMAFSYGGQIVSVLLYLYIHISGLKYKLIRNLQNMTYKLHFSSLWIATALFAVYFGLIVYWAFTGTKHFEYRRLLLLELALRVILAGLALWNLMLKQKHDPKYPQNKCYSIVIVGFFIFHAIAIVIMVILRKDGYGMFVAMSCFNLIIDFCPMLVMIQFTLFYGHMMKEKSVMINKSGFSTFLYRSQRF